MSDAISANDGTTAVFGPDGEPCAGCRAPLAGDQRYCLHCGARRDEARLEFLDVLTQDAREQLPPGTPVASAPGAAVEVWNPAPGAYATPQAAYLNAAGAWQVPPPHEPGLRGWTRANGSLIGLFGILLGTLLIGLLIGHWATAQPAAAPKSQTIRVVGAGAAGAAAAGATAGADAATTTTTGSGGSSSSGSGGSSSGGSKRHAKAAATAAPAGAVSVKKLSSLKGKDYTKAVDKLAKQGKPISTGGGKLPPKDNKPAGNGTSFETIG